MIDLIYEIVLLPNIKKWPKGAMHKGSSYLSETSEGSDLVEIIEVRERKAVPHKQRRKAIVC